MAAFRFLTVGGADEGKAGDDPEDGHDDDDDDDDDVAGSPLRAFIH